MRLKGPLYNGSESLNVGHISHEEIGKNNIFLKDSVLLLSSKIFNQNSCFQTTSETTYLVKVL